MLTSIDIAVLKKARGIVRDETLRSHLRSAVFVLNQLRFFGLFKRPLTILAYLNCFWSADEPLSKQPEQILFAWMALADRLQCDFWTADERLVNSV